ncbi:hypothetical protein LCGC14_1270330 [marine sediment metagenome]|uniref:Uncharacterized protein n=1 Tax=marine sediment metagenome TaxID=412755 RepID=A0A0F9P1E4_9ZZZZ
MMSDSIAEIEAAKATALADYPGLADALAAWTAMMWPERAGQQTAYFLTHHEMPFIIAFMKGWAACLRNRRLPSPPAVEEVAPAW